MGKQKKFRGEMIDEGLLRSRRKTFELTNPDSVELEFLEKTSDIERAIKNAVLDWRKTMWQQWRVGLKNEDISKALTSLKKEEGFEWVSEAPSESLQQSLRDLNKAYKNMWDSGFGFPKFKKKNGHRGQSFRIPRLNTREFSIQKISKKKWNLSGVPKIGSLKFKGGDKNRYISKIRDENDITSATFFKENEKWFVSLVVLEKIPAEIPMKISAVGIDRGVAVSYAISGENSKGVSNSDLSAEINDSEEFHKIPLKIKKLEEKISKLQRQTKRQKRGSKNKRKTYKKIAKTHAKIANIRKDFLAKLTTSIVKKHNIVVLEDLKIKNMSKSAKGTLENPGKMVKQKSGLNKAILRQGWGMFQQMLEYKLSDVYGELILVPPHHTSNTCSNCGHKDPDSRISQEHFVCSSCGFEKNADINAARNILALGLQGQSKRLWRDEVTNLCEARTTLEPVTV